MYGRGGNMDISTKTIVEKMESLIGQARKSSSDHEMQAYATAIKTLCELILEQGPPVQAALTPAKSEGYVNPETVSSAVPDKPMKIDDANGGSLLDF